MKILHIFDHSVPYFSGYTFRSGYILEHQRRMGFEPVVLTSCKHSKQEALKECIDGQTYYRTPGFKNPLSRILQRFPLVRESLQMQRLYKRILSVHREAGGDLIHAHSPVLNGIPALRAGRCLKVPVVYEVRALWEDAGMNLGTYSSQRSVKYRSVRNSETRLCRRVHGITTICEGLRKDIEGRGIDESKITVIPNCVDTERFLPLARDKALMERHGLEPGKVAGFIGSFYDYEGLDILISAFALVRRQRPDLRLLLVGGGYQGQDEALHRQSRDLGLEGTCIFTGRVPHEEVTRYYSIIDLFLYPRRSLRVTELVTPLKPLEAMSMEKIVLGSSVGGIAELVEEGQNGFLFKPDNPESTAETLLRVISNPEAMAEIGPRARRFVQKNRSWPDAVKRYHEVYAAALARHGKALLNPSGKP